MDAVQRTKSNSIDIPKKKSRADSESQVQKFIRQAPRFEYNAGLDQFVPSSPPDEAKRAYKAVDNFFLNFLDWLDPSGAKPRQ